MSRKSDFLGELKQLLEKYSNDTHNAEFYLEFDGGEPVIGIYIPPTKDEHYYDFIYNSEEVS